MKKAFILVTAAILLLSACSTGNKESKVLTSETQLPETTTSAVETTVETTGTPVTTTTAETTTTAVTTITAETTTAKSKTTAKAVTTTKAVTTGTPVTTTTRPAIYETKFKGTIRKGTKLDTAEFDKVGPLIDGKVITFKNIGEPYFKTSNYKNESGTIINWSFSEQEIGYINCKTGEKVTVCKIKPITDANAYVYLDSTYVYVIYMKLPEGKNQCTLSQTEYKNLVTTSNFTVLRINVKTNETKEYTMKTTRKPNFSWRSMLQFQVYILGEDNLIISYNEDVDENVRSYNVILDRLNLSSGETSNFLVFKLGIDVDEHDEFCICDDINEDKLFLHYRKFIDNEFTYGFKVYDTNLKLIDEVEVARDSKQNSGYEYMVDDNNIYCSVNNGTTVKKYAYKNGSYISVPMEELQKNSYSLTVYPRSNSDFPYLIYQDKDYNYEKSTDSSYIKLVTNKEKYKSYGLNIGIEGFKDCNLPHNPNSNYFDTDYKGDYVIISGDEGKSGYGYYYITKEEIMKAFNGG